MAKELSKTCQSIYKYMAFHGGITQAEAFLELGCGRLGARIWDMKNVGIPIRSEMVKVEKKDGSTTYVARYSIGREDGRPE